MTYPDAEDAALVGTYPASVAAGGGYVWDAVLEYRVWCHPERGAPDEDNGNDYYYSFATYQDALEYADENPGTEKPLALIRQDEHINESVAGQYEHIKVVRLTEWPVQFLSRPRRTPNTIPDFLSPDAPPNRLDIIRGIKASNDLKQ